MGEIIGKFMQLNGRTATIILEHYLFGKQKLKAQEIQIFEDDDKLGVVLMKQNVFVYKPQLKSMDLRDDMVEFSDDKLKISIKF